MNRRAQIGTTLTWAVAFLIILFILGLFFAITTGLLVKKGGGNEIKDVGGFNGIGMQRELQFVLNNEVDGGKSVLDYIILWDLEEGKSGEREVKIVVEVTRILEKRFGKENDFSFKVMYEDNSFKGKEILVGEDVFDSLEEGFGRIDLFSENKKLNIMLNVENE